MKTRWHMSCCIILSTRNHLKFFSDKSNPTVLKTLTRTVIENDAQLLDYSYGVLNPVTKKIQFKECSLKITLLINGNHGPEEIYSKLRVALWNELQEQVPNIRTNPLQRNCCIADVLTYTEEEAFGYIQSHDWRIKQKNS